MRGLSERFRKNLQSGLLGSILERIKNDSTLCLGIRNNCINVYYRGGNLMQVKEKKNNYEINFDDQYCAGRKSKIVNALPKVIHRAEESQRWVDAVPSLKEVMDYWFSENPKYEREFQQIVLRENNSSVVGSSTDYFIIDIEYDNHEGARFDMVAIKWDSDGICRKLQGGYKPKLSFIEMKYGDNALSGSAGILKHVDDFKKYVNNHRISDIRNEMLTVFRQLRELKVIPALQDNRNEVKEFSNDIEYLFVLANHDPSSRKVRDTLSIMTEEYVEEHLGFAIKFCVSNFLGYGLYNENVFSLADFKERYSRQIYSKNKICN